MDIYFSILIVIFLIGLSGLFSGLTLGLLSLNKSELERKIKLGDKRAKKIYSVRKKGNLLLCTLLLGNVAVNSALAIFLGNLTTGILAGVISTALIVIFGEIIPQAFCSRFAMTIGAKTVWIVKIFIFVLYPICFPLAWILDKTLGEEMPTIWSRKELAEIIKVHEDSKNSEIDSDEERIILGALSFSNKMAEKIMTPRTVVFTLDGNAVIDDILIEKIIQSGFSRIPVYLKNQDNMIGIFYTRNLMKAKKGKKIKDVCTKKNSFIVAKDNLKLDILLKKFLSKRIHIAIIFGRYGGFKGIVTLEDIIEEVLRFEIMDETDKVRDMQKIAKKKAKRKFKK